MSGCFSCERNARDPDQLPPRERVYDDGLWRVAHALSSSLAGWMCAITRRHLTSISELSPAEASSLGQLLQRLSAALEEATGAAKCYVMFFAEAPGFEHLHIHVVPRLSGLTPDRTGPSVIAYLNEPPDRWVPEDEMDSIAGKVTEALEQQRKERT